jgi:hypothetical protein
MADKNYYPQQQDDINSTEARKHVTIIDVAIDASARVGPYYPGNAHTVTVVATDGAAFEMRGNGSPGPAITVFRSMKMQYATVSPPTAVVAGTITGNAMPHEFYLRDTSGSLNPVTIYFNY